MQNNVGSGSRPRDERTGRCRHDRHDVFVPGRVNTDHVVQLLCKHSTRSSDSLAGSVGAGLSTGSRGGKTVMSHATKADKLLIRPAHSRDSFTT